MSAGNSTDPQSSVGGIPAIIRLQDAAGNVISDEHPLPVAVAVTAEIAFEATAAPPTYTEGQNAPGSQDLSGNLRTRNDRLEAITGATTDAPVADNTTVASATAANGIGLWKRLVNLGIAILAKLPTVGTAGTASANVVTVQGIASGTTIPVASSGTAADNAAASGNPVQTGGVAVVGSTYAPAYTAGDAAVLPIDKDSGGLLVHGRTLTTTDNVTSTPVASSVVATTAYAASKVVKASAGRLFSVNGYNSKGSAQFIQIHNAISLPADTTVPLAILTVPASSNFSIDFGPLGIPCATGITLANSSTGPTLTVGSADVWFNASFT